ncbi:hypothetical protein ACFVY4_02520, partial [Streptomyces sp. NPDC058299]|uniref:hypothetical protein n=1 Tax=Streptomyces sp. NPDC058299 TaxID=3346435 RepID=UPI0036EF3A01
MPAAARTPGAARLSGLARTPDGTASRTPRIPDGTDVPGASRTQDGTGHPGRRPRASADTAVGRHPDACRRPYPGGGTPVG